MMAKTLKTYMFKPAFLDRMTGIQLRSWVEAAEEVMQSNDIRYSRDFVDGRLAFNMASEHDYWNVCNLSHEIGLRALSIESNYIIEGMTDLRSRIIGSASSPA